MHIIFSDKSSSNQHDGAACSRIRSSQQHAGSNGRFGNSEHFLTAATTACDSCSTHDDSIACPTYGLSATAGSCELPAREPASRRRCPARSTFDAKLRMASLCVAPQLRCGHLSTAVLTQRMALHRSILSLSSGPTRMEKSDLGMGRRLVVPRFPRSLTNRVSDLTNADSGNLRTSRRFFFSSTRRTNCF